MYAKIEVNKFPVLNDIIEQMFGICTKGEQMGYINDMTMVLLDEIDMAEKLIKYSLDAKQSEWFSAKAAALIEQINQDYSHYKEVTEIESKAKTDNVAETMYRLLNDRIHKLSMTQGCGQ